MNNTNNNSFKNDNSNLNGSFSNVHDPSSTALTWNNLSKNL